MAAADGRGSSADGSERVGEDADADAEDEEEVEESEDDTDEDEDEESFMSAESAALASASNAAKLTCEVAKKSTFFSVSEIEAKSKQSSIARCE
jgi:hypothetical protein